VVDASRSLIEAVFGVVWFTARSKNRLTCVKSWQKNYRLITNQIIAVLWPENLRVNKIRPGKACLLKPYSFFFVL